MCVCVKGGEGRRVGEVVVGEGWWVDHSGIGYSNRGFVLTRIRLIACVHIMTYHVDLPNLL